MLKNNKTAAFLVIISVLFPLFHHETASHLVNGRKATSKSILKVNINNSNIKISRRTTKLNDIDLYYDEILLIKTEFFAQAISTDSLKFKAPVSKYSFWSKATFS